MPGSSVLHYFPDWVGDATWPSHILPPLSPLVFNLSQNQVFSNESALHIMWLKYCSLSFNISPFNESSAWISFELNSLVSLLSRNSQESSPTPQFKNINSSTLNHLYGPTLTSIHDYWKNHSFDYMEFFCKVISLLFNKLSRFVIVFLLRSKYLLISWQQSRSALILEPKESKICHHSHFSPSIWHEVMGPDVKVLVFWMLSFKPAFFLSSFTLIKRLFGSSNFCHKSGITCISEVADISPSNLNFRLWFIQRGISHNVHCI